MDIQIIESGDGGDVVKLQKDVKVVFGFENMPFLALFGGNIEQDTPSVRIATEQAFDWWANSLGMQGDPGIQFNSQTERVLKNVSLTSSGRLLIQQAVENDLAFMKDFCEVVVLVQIVKIDTVIIGIRLTQPDNLQSSDFVFIWDSTRIELTQISIDGSIVRPITIKYFEQSFDFSFE